MRLRAPGRARAVRAQLHPTGDYEKMLGQRRNKPRKAAPEPGPSPRAAQPRRRRRAPGAGEPDMDESPREEAEKPGPPAPKSRPRPRPKPKPRPVGGGNLPRAARPHSPRRPRKSKAQNCVQMQVVAKSLFLQRFQFLNCVLEQLRDKVHVLRRRQLSLRATAGLGERRGPSAPGLGAVWGRLEEDPSHRQA